MTQWYFKPALDLSIPSFDFGTSFPTHTSAEAWNAMETQAAEAASEITAWRPTTWGKCGYGETEVHQAMLRRCSIRALDLFVAFLSSYLPELRLNDEDRYWIVPAFEASRIKVDQNLDDKILF
jgi:hypothetical protein